MTTVMIFFYINRIITAEGRQSRNFWWPMDCVIDEGRGVLRIKSAITDKLIAFSIRYSLPVTDIQGLAGVYFFLRMVN